MNDTLIVSVIFQEIDIVKKHVDFLAGMKDLADVVLLENKSKNTDIIKEYCSDLVKNNKIFKYYLFDENIGMNVFETFFNRFKIDDYKYIVVTDGDLTCDNNDWLNEVKYILEKYPNTFCCGVKMNNINLPLRSFPEAISWIVPPSEVKDDYEQGITGLHFLTYKTKNFKLFFNHLKNNKNNFMDVVMHRFVQSIHRSWKRTVKNLVYHHTWDLYLDKNNEYTQLKINNSPRKLWFHNKFCNYIEFSNNNIINHTKYKRD